MDKKQIEAEARRMSDESLKMLISNILIQAKQDSDHTQYAEDIKSFIDSEWGQTLCLAVNVDTNAFIESLGTNVSKICKTRVDRRYKQ